MHQIADLEIEDEILPLFNYTCNDFAEFRLINLLKTPLQSIEEINIRQQILKGFLKHINILKNYHYARQELNEVYEFTKGYNSTGSEKKFLSFNKEKTNQRETSNIIQMILLFRRIGGTCISRLQTDEFPQCYATEIKKLHEFLSELNFPEMEIQIHEQPAGKKQIKEILNWLKGKTNKGDITDFWNRLFQFEAYISITVAISKNNFSFPSFKNGGMMIEEFFHPLLNNPVRNNITWNKNTIILTGPNMSGKSTLMKSVALCIYLAHTGIAVPAARVITPFFDCICVFIQLRDNLQSGYSHFMNEIQNLKNVLTCSNQNKSCFAVFDELFRGTNEDDASEILEKTIKGISARFSSYFILSTHINKLKNEEIILNGKVQLLYLDCELNGNNPIFSYKVKEGWSELRLGRVLFDNEGLNELLLYNDQPKK